MPIETLHAAYTAHMAEWRRMRDVLAGRDAVIAAGEDYLPALEHHRTNPIEYTAYINRGRWHGAAARTHDAFQAAIFRREPMARLTRRTEHLRENTSGIGDNFYTFSKSATAEILATGRYGLLVDRPRDGGPPYLTGYPAEAIRNWRLRRINGKLVPDQIILWEEDETPSDDGFGAVSLGRYRVIELDADQTYRVRIFTTTAESGDFQETDRFTPRPTGRPIDYLPFVFLAPTNLRPSVERPPLLDIADANLAHWRVSCDLHHGLHKLAWPTPVLTGVDSEDGAVWRVGNEVWMLPMGAQFGMLEMRGDGLGALERELDRIKSDMAQLGARMLQDQKRVVETAEALSIRASGENSTLANISRTTGDGFQQALRWAADWEDDDPGQVAVELNQDFHDGRMSSQELLSLVSTYQAGLLPLDDFLWNLQQGEILKPGRTLEEAAALLSEQVPILVGAPEDLGSENDQPARAQSAPGGIQTSTRSPRSPQPEPA